MKNTSSDRQNTENELLPADEIAQDFFDYFCHRWDYIEDDPAEERWETHRNHKLKERAFWEHYQSEESIIGVRFGQTTLYAMADLDLHSGPQKLQEKDK